MQFAVRVEGQKKDLLGLALYDSPGTPLLFERDSRLGNLNYSDIGAGNRFGSWQGATIQSILGELTPGTTLHVSLESRMSASLLLRYCARPPFAGQRIRIEDEKVAYRCLMSKLSTRRRAGRHKRRWQARTRDRPNTAGIHRTNRSVGTCASAAQASLL
jgi:hypothetical protein